MCSTSSSFDFQVALDVGQGAAAEKAADLQVRRNAGERRQHLSDLATTPEQQQLYVGNASRRTGVDAATAGREAAINSRDAGGSPVNGYVTIF